MYVYACVYVKENCILTYSHTIEKAASFASYRPKFIFGFELLIDFLWWIRNEKRFSLITITQYFNTFFQIEKEGNFYHIQLSSK